VFTRIFDLKGHGTTVRTELIAGLTTFLTMAYIIVVNPLILGDAGMPVAGVAVATCIAAGFGSILMGLLSNYPLALAPGMGLNAYFTYTVVKTMGLPWQVALGCVFISGVAFLVLTLAGVRQLIMNAVPRSLFAAVSGGIGLFIAFIGLKDAGIIVANAGTTVALGKITAPTPALAMLGLFIIAALQARAVKGAILIGILSVAIISWIFGLASFTPSSTHLADLWATAFRLDIPAALNLKGGIGLSLVEIMFVFLFVDMFDNLGTLMAVTKRAGFVRADGTVPRMNRILIADSTSMLVGALAGTSPVTSYIESAAGVAVGGRTGLTSGDRTGADTGGRADDGCARGGAVAGTGRGHSGLSHGDHDSTDLLDRQRACLRHREPRGTEAGARTGAPARLADLRARSAVCRALHLSRVTGRSHLS
jgi:AGZA family xanthine/uracil permease-like MFS transporter